MQRSRRVEGRSYAHRLYRAGGRDDPRSDEHPDRSAWEKPGFVLWHATLRWQRMVTAALKPIGLTHVQFVLLASAWFLEDRTGPPSQRELAEHAGTDAMMTSQVLRSLESGGPGRAPRRPLRRPGEAPHRHRRGSHRRRRGPRRGRRPRHAVLRRRPAIATTSSPCCSPSPAATSTAPPSTDRPPLQPPNLLRFRALWRAKPQQVRARRKGGRDRTGQAKTQVRLSHTSTRCSRWRRTASASVLRSTSRPLRTRSSTSSRWVTVATPWAMIGPASSSAVT